MPEKYTDRIGRVEWNYNDIRLIQPEIFSLKVEIWEENDVSLKASHRESVCGSYIDHPFVHKTHIIILTILPGKSTFS